MKKTRKRKRRRRVMMIMKKGVISVKVFMWLF